jgi:hypothetical protein
MTFPDNIHPSPTGMDYASYFSFTDLLSSRANITPVSSSNRTLQWTEESSARMTSFMFFDLCS